MNAAELIKRSMGFATRGLYLQRTNLSSARQQEVNLIIMFLIAWPSVIVEFIACSHQHLSYQVIPFPTILFAIIIPFPTKNLCYSFIPHKMSYTPFFDTFPAFFCNFFKRNHPTIT